LPDSTRRVVELSDTLTLRSTLHGLAAAASTTRIDGEPRAGRVTV